MLYVRTYVGTVGMWRRPHGVGLLRTRWRQKGVSIPLRASIPAGMLANVGNTTCMPWQVSSCRLSTCSWASRQRTSAADQQQVTSLYAVLKAWRSLVLCKCTTFIQIIFVVICVQMNEVYIMWWLRVPKDFSVSFLVRLHFSCRVDEHL